MSFARVSSAQATLLSAHLIDIEVDITSASLNAFSIVGLGDKAVEESRHRISAAIKNAGFTSPKSTNQKTVISLAPANLKKEGAIFELGMAVAYLLATEDMDFNPEGKLFIGELALDGTLRPIRGTLPLIRKAKESGIEEVFLPRGNAHEAGIIEGVRIYPADSLKEVIEHFDNKKPETVLSLQPQTIIEENYDTEFEIDFADVRGQENAKRALFIAAAGGHNIAMSGPPGAGKTMLTKALAGILPKLSFKDALDVTSIHSVAGILEEPLKTTPPVRTPHHTASYVSIVGGGNIPKPGEITLAHKGVLFLDEFPEFDRRVIETLRQPLEDRFVTIARAGGTARFPADIMLVAAMNPCPCGNYGVEGRECACPAFALERYRRKLSGPIIDRIDLWVDIPATDIDTLLEKGGNRTPSADFRKKILDARLKQAFRAKQFGLKQARNSTLGARDIDIVTNLSDEAKLFLNQAAKTLEMSARGYHRVIKVARTIADIEGEDILKQEHIAEALQYRPKGEK